MNLQLTKADAVRRVGGIRVHNQDLFAQYGLQGGGRPLWHMKTWRGHRRPRRGQPSVRDPAHPGAVPARGRQIDRRVLPCCTHVDDAENRLCDLVADSRRCTFPRHHCCARLRIRGGLICGDGLPDLLCRALVRIQRQLRWRCAALLFRNLLGHLLGLLSSQSFVACSPRAADRRHSALPDPGKVRSSPQGSSRNWSERLCALTAARRRPRERQLRRSTWRLGVAHRVRARADGGSCDGMAEG